MNNNSKRSGRKNDAASPRYSPSAPVWYASKPISAAEFRARFTGPKLTQAQQEIALLLDSAIRRRKGS